MNMTLLIKMIEMYHSIASTHNYIFGFRYDNGIYHFTTNGEHLDLITTLDKASRDGGFSLRFKPTRQQKKLIFEMFNPELICSEMLFDEIVKNSKYNNGEIFEKIETELNGQKWKKDNKKFTECGDIQINGIEYQIKFEKATFTNEKTLLNLIKRE